MYSKTSKGLNAITKGIVKFPYSAASVLAQIGDRSDIVQIHLKCTALSNAELKRALDWLLREDYIQTVVENLQAVEDLPEAHTPGDTGVELLDPVKGLQEWAKAQRMAKALVNNGFCSSGNIQRTKPENASILLIEDDPRLAMLEEAILEREGYLVSHVESGELALEKLQGGYMPDAIILDIILPGMDGIKTLQAIRSNAGTAHLPVIMVTSKVSDEDVMEGLINGADGYIFKPFQPKKLASHLLEVLGW